MPRKLFVKGQSGNPGGVPKDNRLRNPCGTSKKHRIQVKEILDSLDFRPFEEMVAIYRNPKTKDKYKVDILIDLCGYIAPKLKHVEISSDNENPFVINLNLLPGKKRLDVTQTLNDESQNDDDESEAE